VAVELRFLDASEHLLATVALESSAPPAPGIWQTWSQTHLVPPGCTHLEFLLRTTTPVAADFDECELSLTRTTRAQTFEEWQSHYFSPAEIADPLLSGPDVVPLEGGPLPLFARYAARRSRWDGHPRGEVLLDSAGPILRFPFDPRRRDVRYALEQSATLAAADWTRTELGDSLPEIDAEGRARLPLEPPTAAPWFVRLHVEPDPAEIVP
jgi:hypothetical protein